LAGIGAQLKELGLMLRERMIAGATILAAPPSVAKRTKNGNL